MKKDRHEEFFVDSHEAVDRREEIMSPSGRFRLLIRYYGTQSDCWGYSRGTVYRVSDGIEVCDIKRNFDWFVYSFAEKRIPCHVQAIECYEEWFIAGRSYMGQTIVNLDKGILYEPPGDQYDTFAFCWADHKLSPDGNTLMVEGCHWACPYEYRFYDFTKPEKGWPELKVSPDKYLSVNGKKPPVWREDGTFECYETQEIFKPLNKDVNRITKEEFDGIPPEQENDESNYEDVVVVRTVLRRNGDTMEVVEKWISEDERKRQAEYEEHDRKFKEFVKNFKATDKLYLTMKRHIVWHLLPSTWGDWWGWAGDQRTVGRNFSLGGGRTVEVRWGIESGPITVEYYDGDKKRKIEVERSEHGMLDALRLIGKQVGVWGRLVHLLKGKWHNG